MYKDDNDNGPMLCGGVIDGLIVHATQKPNQDMYKKVQIFYLIMSFILFTLIIANQIPTRKLVRFIVYAFYKHD